MFYIIFGKIMILRKKFRGRMNPKQANFIFLQNIAYFLEPQISPHKSYQQFAIYCKF